MLRKKYYHYYLFFFIYLCLYNNIIFRCENIEDITKKKKKNIFLSENFVLLKLNFFNNFCNKNMYKNSF